MLCRRSYHHNLSACLSKLILELLTDLYEISYEYRNTRSVFPLSCAGTPPRSNWNAPAHIELFPRSWNFSVFTVNIIIIIIIIIIITTHITKKTSTVPRSRQAV
jgi:hypothetical protein